MDNAHEFLLWLYEHCQDGHLTFRMLRKGEAKEKDIPLSQFRKMPDVIEPSFKKAEDEGYDCYFGS